MRSRNSRVQRMLQSVEIATADLILEAGAQLQRLLKILLSQIECLELIYRAHGGIARFATERRHLTDNLPGAEYSDLALRLAGLAHRNRHGAAADEKDLVTDLTLAYHELA